MRRKGQAAMEFLMTYGWAILVVLAAIGALAYFGILSPDRFLPESCTGPAGLDCLEKASIDATNNSISFALKNNLGIHINVTAVADGDTSETSSCDTVSSGTIQIAGSNTTTTVTSGNGVRVNNGQSFVMKIQCDDDIVEGRASGTFAITYASLSTGLQQKGSVNVKGKAIS